MLLDADLADLYGVTTKRLNEQVKRNSERFPYDFVFRLSESEKEEVVANCDHLRNLKYSRHLPYEFSEHGAIMLASVLNSSIAVEASVQVVRTFVRLRHLLASHDELSRRLNELEQRYDEQFRMLFDAIRELMEPEPPSDRKRIGFPLDM